MTRRRAPRPAGEAFRAARDQPRRRPAWRPCRRPGRRPSASGSRRSRSRSPSGPGRLTVECIGRRLGAGARPDAGAAFGAAAGGAGGAGPEALAFRVGRGPITGTFYARFAGNLVARSAWIQGRRTGILMATRLHAPAMVGKSSRRSGLFCDQREGLYCLRRNTAAQKKGGSYGAEDITVLEGLEAVRKRPGHVHRLDRAARPAPPRLRGRRQLGRRGARRLLRRASASSCTPTTASPSPTTAAASRSGPWRKRSGPRPKSC